MEERPLNLVLGVKELGNEIAPGEGLERQRWPVEKPDTGSVLGGRQETRGTSVRDARIGTGGQMLPGSLWSWECGRAQRI